MNLENETYCSDEDLPLSVARISASYQFIPKSELLKYTKERCEICDKVFYDKYSLLLHNTKHIIIPLLRQKLYQCFDCNKPFISLETLKRHTINDHLNITNENDYVPELIESFIKTESYAVINKEDLEVKDENDITIENEGISEVFVGRQPITLLSKEPLLSDETEEVNEELLKGFVKQESVVLEPLIINIDDESTDSSTTTSYEQSNTNKIRDKILFENESDEEDIIILSNGVMTDLTNNCNVNIEPMISEIKNEGKDGNSGIIKSNSISLGQFTISEENNTVHYEELMKPGVYKCKKCSYYFPNRYTLITHEKEHITFKMRLPFLCRICDWYIGNNRWCYQKHMDSKHPNQEFPKVKNLYTCRLCRLKFRHKRNHYENYHPDVEQKSPGKDKGPGQDNLECPVEENKRCPKQDIERKWISLKVCEICFKLDMKMKQHYYKVLRMYNSPDLCNVCSKERNDLMLVNCKKRYVHRMPKKKKKAMRRCLTNSERLEVVHKRLRKLKMLNKF